MFSTTEKEVIQSAIDQLSAIPSENFLDGAFTNGTDKCCVIGHLTRLASKNPEDYSADNCSDRIGEDFGYIGRNPLRVLSERFLTSKGASPKVTIADVNNYHYFTQTLYPQSEVKDRVIACLEDMLATELVEA